MLRSLTLDVAILWAVFFMVFLAALLYFLNKKFPKTEATQKDNNIVAIMTMVLIIFAWGFALYAYLNGLI